MADPDLVRRLVTLLAADLPSQTIHHELHTAGYQEAEILDGWVEARLAGYTESTGLGRDRLTRVGERWQSPVRGCIGVAGATEPPGVALDSLRGVSLRQITDYARRLQQVEVEHDLPLEEYHRANERIINGDPGGYVALYSHRDDVTVANPFGPPVRGWTDVSATVERAATHYEDGEIVGFQNVSTVVGADLAYTIEIESYRARIGRGREVVPFSLRVTTVFRREDGAWNIVHRHADPITSTRPPESIVSGT